MERLTKRLDLGLDEWEQITYAVKDDLDGLYNILDLAEYVKDKEMKKILIAVTEKLAEYEDTGLTPNEIQDIKNILDTDGDGFGNKEILEIILELAKYKKTGLSPQDVTNLDDVSCRQSNAIVKMGEKIENLEKELETWKRDAIESKAKLGEIRIKLGD